MKIEFLSFDCPLYFHRFYNILHDKPESDFKNHKITFRCQKCEDVIEFRFKSIHHIYLGKDFLEVHFDENGVWLTSYDNIEDIWIEECNIDDEQKTLFEV